MYIIGHLGSVYKDASGIQVEERDIVINIVTITIDVITKEILKKKSSYIHHESYFTYKVNSIIQSFQFPVLEFFKCFCSDLNSTER